MAIRLTAVRLAGGYEHQHITHLWWTNPSTGESGSSSKATLVDWIENDGKAYVEEDGHRVNVGVVKPSSGSKYLRTYADGVWTNNLLSLPRR
ncbi:DUF3892 domain-containing protein [Gordonia hongkongensis]|uniref:DUF3892 domain-containing protein n=1 Tax=Gordonia hongkongensis TaxID=1701090 RepID=A0AAX3T3E8_9ACTN|nr:MULTISPECIES: DUF3892 domain-containing protein [Gordonia]QIK47294.1 DUF3892 domain-containing protein [Gordonia terrae]MBN0971948.1 DUF3892 domain-containing protein [Gordonia sp. BP-119]MBN0982803.1 DUF3892 domain-containing protein [Gordonia sp. BP-94]MDF6101592.1 DUF3892 domain-containing protein [Gordonia hongkongensis]WFP23672.1 DUF3892 domain-containing protein [Gordonia hongkongensis]